MDQKQFERLQAGVQWVVDEKHARDEGHGSLISHMQHRWGYGRATDERLTGTFDSNDGMAINWNHRAGEEYEVAVVCESACCLAGNVVSAHGDKFVTTASERSLSESTGMGLAVFFCMDDQNTIHRVGQRAKELMGLSDLEADSLFHENNSSTTIVEKATAIAALHGYELTVL